MHSSGTSVAPEAAEDASASAEEAFKRLREALLHDEQSRLADLETRLDDDTTRSAELSAVLPLAIARSEEETLARSLNGAVGRCITDSVKGNPGFYADALYPVMGPSIRRAITAAFRAMVQSVSQTIDASISPRSLSWRWTAWRNGIPFHELVLRNTLQYRVEQVFLVQPGSGLLIAHAAREDTDTAESDAVSAMLSAIQDFVADSFLRENHGQKLDSIEFGDYNIWLMYGPNGVMAAVLRGFAPEPVREHFVEVLEQLHGTYGPLLADFDGDRSRTEPMVPLLTECLLEELRSRPSPGLPRSARIAFIVIALAALAGTAYGLYTRYQFDQRVAAFEAAIAGEPGLVLTSLSVNGGHLSVRGLRDPLAQAPASIAGRFGFAEGDELSSVWNLYQTLEPPIARKRAMALLAVPDSVTATFDGDVLRLAGGASSQWIQRARIVALTIPGVARLDTSALQDDQTLFARQVREALALPDSLTLSIRGRDVRLLGEAPLDWLPRLAELREAVPGIGLLDVSRVTLAARALDDIRLALDARTVYFEEGIDIRSALSELDEVAGIVRQLAATVRLIAHRVELRVLGSTDGVGSRASNVALATQRSRVVIDRLVERGVPRDWMQAEIGSLGDESGTEANAEKRRASFTIAVVR